MSAEQVQHKLAAILHADVVGYSRVMAEDEDATVRLVTAYREEVKLLVHQHRGQLVERAAVANAKYETKSSAGGFSNCPPIGVSSPCQATTSRSCGSDGT